MPLGPGPRASAGFTGIRKLKFTNPERKRLIERVNKTVDAMRPLDRQINNLEKKIEATRVEETQP